MENKKRGFVRKHKVMSMVIMITILLIGFNGVMIYEFLNLLRVL